MSRWEPDGRRRLQEAALELYAEQGFGRTTAAAVAERAGLTERTFFRYFADKKEVLFGNEERLRTVLADAAAAVVDTATPRDVVATGLEAVAVELDSHRESVLRRAAVIASDPELRERELTKLMAWSAALATVLRDRGATAPDVTAEVAVTVFRVAFQRWAGGSADGELAAHVREALDDLTAFVRD
ncbi:TetR family transcriptional regulator [Umezawaea sp. Da 62-37]|uniref:TetR family transcriptional regulator n=1 Tax=Umezawaea sp. Da 62-37 TaxID=3075927 RepID=UPI0028F70B22|nr:TetR family transcriptional regulator [Umezawaea sp. Da 62-37]WNV86482.1 TetR family transcriptional regulator [Umezawaea sp. Da 62-37]